MMEIFTLIKKNTYQDSMKLMQLQTSLQSVPGVVTAGVAMASPENKAQFKGPGLLSAEIEEATPNDLCIVVKAETSEAIAVIRAEVEKHFSARRVSEGYSGATHVLPRSIATALRRQPNTNLAFISVPGPYAALEATKALQNGLHVFLFSDNVSVEDEVELKALAANKGLLVMGPDCGTAILAGVPLGFANAVRKGSIGIIGASGTGMQEVSSLIHRMGEGISQAIGTGSRDLSSKVGGRTFVTALKALLADDETRVIVLMSKHCDKESAARIMEMANRSPKPMVVYLPGSDTSFVSHGGQVERADNLEHIASLSVALARGESPPPPITGKSVLEDLERMISAEAKRFSAEQRYIRALYGGGTFADQARMILPEFLGRVYAYPAHGDTQPLDDPLRSHEHSIIDLGDDFFTRGRVHPMIDPALCVERIRTEMKDASIRLFLLDVVLGYGSHADPAGVLSVGIAEARRCFSARGGHVSFVVSLCGTDGDFQNFAEQKRKLEEVGAIVMESSTRAVYFAGWLGSR